MKKLTAEERKELNEWSKKEAEKRHNAKVEKFVKALKGKTVSTLLAMDTGSDLGNDKRLVVYSMIDKDNGTLKSDYVVYRNHRVNLVTKNLKLAVDRYESL